MREAPGMGEKGGGSLAANLIELQIEKASCASHWQKSAIYNSCAFDLICSRHRQIKLIEK